MKQNQALKFKVISLMLGYPDESLKRILPELAEASSTLWPGDAKPLEPLLKDLGEKPLIRLQESYTATFDLNPGACLNLTYHRWGDGEERGRALAEMGEVYNRSGWAPASTELPDYLPMILEYLSANGDHPDAAVFKEHLDAVETLENRLRESKSPYADLFSAILFEIRGSEIRGSEIMGSEIKGKNLSAPERIEPSKEGSGLRPNR